MREYVKKQVAATAATGAKGAREKKKKEPAKPAKGAKAAKPAAAIKKAASEPAAAPLNKWVRTPKSQRD